MRISLLIFACIVINSCVKCKSKYEVLNGKEEHKEEILKKHGDILPPLIDEVPDVNDCDRKMTFKEWLKGAFEE